MARNMLEELTGIPFGENNDHSNDQSIDQQRYSGLRVTSVKKDQGLGMPDTWNNTKEVTLSNLHTDKALMNTPNAEDRSSLKDNTQKLYTYGNSCTEELKNEQSSSRISSKSSQLLKKQKSRVECSARAIAPAHCSNLQVNSVI